MVTTLSKLAADLGLSLRGEDREVRGVNTLDRASETELTFFANPKYAPLLGTTRAAAVIVDEEHAHLVGTALVSANPYLDFARAVGIFSQPQGVFEGQSDLAWVHPEAEVDASATVFPFAFVGARARIGAGTRLFPGCYVGEDSVVGANCTLYPNVTLMSRTRLGDNVIVQPGAVLGGDGFGFARSEFGMEKFPQVGNVVIGNDVEIGANTAVDRAALGETKIGSGAKIDNLVQIAHNVEVGDGSILVSQVGISGSTKLGKGVVLAGQVGVTGHISIGDGVRVAAKSGVHRSIPAGTEMGGIPAMDRATYLRYMASASRLPDLVRTVARLEKELAALKDRLDGSPK